MKDYKLYLFDLDGTLVNSEPLKGQALALACADFGSQVDYHIYKEVMGQSWPIVTNHFFKSAGITPEIDKFNQIFRNQYEHLLGEDLELNPGAREYIETIKSAGKQCCVVSSAARWMVDNILDSLKLNSMFDLIITREDVTNHKPDPEAYILALNKMSVSAADAVVFEDSTAGVSAGFNSGCDVIAIQHTFNTNNDLNKALKIINSYKELEI